MKLGARREGPNLGGAKNGAARREVLERAHLRLIYVKCRVANALSDDNIGGEMSILGKIMSAILGSSSAAAGAAPSTTPASGPASQASAAQLSAKTSAAPMSEVDVGAVLTQLAAKNKEKLDWRRSIVDLMKLLNLDSSLASRKQLAQELHYSGDMNDSASMNVWLHKQVMRKLAENGGKVPDDLKS
jgi:Domain of unknown function (DUF3597)